MNNNGAFRPAMDTSDIKQEKIIILAGAGDFPLIAARALAARGAFVSAIAFLGETSPEISSAADDVSWVKLGSLAALLDAIASKKIPRLILAGKIEHKYLFTKNLDAAAREFFEALADTRAESVLAALAARFAALGVSVIPSTTALEDLMALAGPLSKIIPDEKDLAAAALGKKIASTLAALDCGQTVVVNNGTVVALEGVEGTDETIKRAGLLSGPGNVIVKVSRPKQDLRFDVPVVGAGTVRAAAGTKARLLAVEAGKTLILDKEKLVAVADETGVAVYGI